MTNEELRNKIEALKLEKELAELQAEAPVVTEAPKPEACQPVAPHVVKAQPRNVVDNGLCERTDYAPGFKGNRDEINLARTRCWGAVAAHAVPPVGSAIYAAKTGKWGAFAAGTVVAVVGAPLAVADAGFTSLLVAPATSILLTVKSITDARKRLGITEVSQADAMKFASF